MNAIENVIYGWYGLSEGFKFSDIGSDNYDDDAADETAQTIMNDQAEELCETLLGLFKDSAKWREFQDNILISDGLGRINEQNIGHLLMPNYEGKWLAAIATPVDNRLLKFKDRKCSVRNIQNTPCLLIEMAERDDADNMTFGEIMKLLFGSYTFLQILENGGCFCDENWTPIANELNFIMPVSNDTAMVRLRTKHGICIEERIQKDNAYNIVSYSIAIPTTIIDGTINPPLEGIAKTFGDMCVDIATPFAAVNKLNYDVKVEDMEAWPDNSYKVQHGASLKRLIIGISKYFNNEKVTGNLNWIDVSDCGYLSEAFKGINLTGADISKWNPKNCESFQSMFMGAKCDGVLDLSKWKMPKATDVREMFAGAKIDKLLLPKEWDLSALPKYNIVKMFNSFEGEFGDISNWKFDATAGRWTPQQLANQMLPFALCEWAGKHPECLPKIFIKFCPKILQDIN